MNTEQTKALLHRWYDEMWFPKNADLVPELAGPVYTRHEFGESRQVTAADYQDQVRSLQAQFAFTDMRYRLIAEGDHVAAIGSWLANGDQWTWVQAFRAEDNKLVETWLSGLTTGSHWTDDVVRTI